MSNIKLFESKKIRSSWNADEEKWYFSVQDVVEILTDSADIKQYIKRLKSRDPELFTNWGTTGWQKLATNALKKQKTPN